MERLESSSFQLLDERIQRWIWQAGWSELKDVQERATRALLQDRPDRDLIIAAATASGKTEAAFFPILTTMLASPRPVSALYISPLKALINDQWSRLEHLCETLEIPVVPWHGDISDTRKKRFVKRPVGCLLITPESLEGLLMREGHSLSGLFGSLQFIVIDELHAFIDTERGKQLQSLMNRIDIALKRTVRRVGLSATLGEMRMAAEFLRPGHGAAVEIIESENAGQELKVLIKGYYDRPPKLTDKEIEARERVGEEVQKEDTLPEAVVAIGSHLFSAMRGSNNLIFPNSRGRVELYADLLRRACEHAGLPNEFWAHHGSLAKDIREETETALKRGDKPATAVATTTLELGIDIGAVKSVAQIGPAPSVANLRQRLGRSGRRKGEPAILRAYCIEQERTPDSPISDRLHEGLVQSIAQVELLTRGWFEPPRIQSLHLSTLVQQLLSLIAQYGGITTSQAWSVLFGSFVFHGLTKEAFTALLREMGKRDLLQQDSQGLLLPTPKAEKFMNHYSFLAAFVSDEEFRIVTNGKTLGTLPLSRPVDEGAFIIFAGRRWKVIASSTSEKLIEVVPAAGGKVPLFDGMAGKIHDEVRREMRAILETDILPPYLDATAQTMLLEARRGYQETRLHKESVQAFGAIVRVFTWRGDWVNDTLALLLTFRGIRAHNEGLSISVSDSTPERVIDALYDIGQESPPESIELVMRVQNKRLEKWDWVLPEGLLNLNYASSQLDVSGAIDAARDCGDKAEARSLGGGPH